jgi:hypothetical protein
MKLRSFLLSTYLLFTVCALSYAQMVPGGGPMTPTSSNGTVISSPANGVAYFAATGNKVVGGTVLTFNPSTNTLSTTNLTVTSISNGCGTWTAGVAGSTGAPCSTSSGSVNPGTINQMAWYSATGSAVSGLPTLASGILVTSAGGVPSISTTLPFIVPVTTGGTGAATYTLNGVLYGNGTNPLQVTAQGAANSVLTANAGTPSFSDSPTLNNLTVNTTITNGSQTTGAVLYTNGSNQFTTSSALLFNGVTLTGVDADFQAYILTNSPVHGSHNIFLVPPATTFTDWTMTLPTTLGGAGQPLVSSGNGGVPATWGSITGTGSFFATSTSSPSDGCATWTTGNIGSTATTCGVGTVNSGTLGQYAFYNAAGNAVSGLTATSNGIAATNGSGAATILPTANSAVLNTTSGGVPSLTASPVIGTSVTTPQIYGNSTAAGSLRLTATSNGSPSGDKIFMSTGGLIKQVVDDGGVFIAQGAPGANASAQLNIGPSTTTAGSSPLKFNGAGSLLTTPEAGSFEFVNNDLYFTPQTQRRLVQIANMAGIPATSITTGTTNLATVNVVSGETYIVNIYLTFTSVANTAIIGFNGGTTGNANILTINQFGNGLVPTGIGSLAANSAGTVTAIGNAISININGIFTASATGTFGINIHSNTGTIQLLAGSYYSYTEFQ